LRLLQTRRRSAGITTTITSGDERIVTVIRYSDVEKSSETLKLAGARHSTRSSDRFMELDCLHSIEAESRGRLEQMVLSIKEEGLKQMVLSIKEEGWNK